MIVAHHRAFFGIRMPRACLGDGVQGAELYVPTELLRLVVDVELSDCHHLAVSRHAAGVYILPVRSG